MLKSIAKSIYQAKQNLLALRTPEAAALRQACSLNLMSCYLKTGQFEKTIAEGVEVLFTFTMRFDSSIFLGLRSMYSCFSSCCQVLGSDANNLKALYRRGQAYKELGNLRVHFHFFHHFRVDMVMTINNDRNIATRCLVWAASCC